MNLHESAERHRMLESQLRQQCVPEAVQAGTEIRHAATPAEDLAEVAAKTGRLRRSANLMRLGDRLLLRPLRDIADVVYARLKHWTDRVEQVTAHY